MKETEAKLLVNESIKEILDERCSLISEVHILDIYYDSNNTLSMLDKVLRIRKIDNKILIAYKGPREKGKEIISREEIETEAGEEIYDIVEKLGFKPTARVEKYRRTYLHERFPSTKIELDKYPFIGDQLEIEGDNIYDIINELNLRGYEKTTRSCSELFLDWAEKNNKGLTLLDFTFEKQKNYN